jgi:Cytochrome c
MTSRLAAIATLAALGVAACSSASTPEPDLILYLHDSTFRRSELEQSLVNPDNSYSELRLQHYATGRAGDWDALPVWNPPIVPVRVANLGPNAPASQPLPAGARALAISAAASQGSAAALRALGELAFTRYPVQTLDPGVLALASPSAAARYGLWSDPDAGIGGLVWTRMADGSARLSMTCSTCHARETPDGLAAGLPNASFNLGHLLADAAGDERNALVQAWLAWGPGRLDPASPAGLEPVRIPDLRPVRDELYLQADATVEQRDVASLAIRIETLIVTSQSQVVRPPREVALGLALYLRSLADELPNSEPAPSTPAARGHALFDQSCATCHSPPEYSGPPVAIHVVGTDPVEGRSPERGTGTYRVPSLRGVAARGPLLHDGSLPDLSAMFDSARLDPSYDGGRLGPGAVPGHTFGLELSAGDRAALLDFLKSL